MGNHLASPKYYLTQHDRGVRQLAILTPAIALLVGGIAGLVALNDTPPRIGVVQIAFGGVGLLCYLVAVVLVVKAVRLKPQSVDQVARKGSLSGACIVLLMLSAAGMTFALLTAMRV